MQAITTIGLDVAKSVFQVHGIDVEGNVIIRRQLKRRLRHERDRVEHPARCEGWEGEQHVMQSRSIRRSGQPTCARASSNASF